MKDVIDFFGEHKTLVIVRGLYGDELLSVVDALYKGGIRMAEVTFDQADPDAIKKTSDAIRLIKNNFADMRAGSGTCTRVSHVVATREAGGEYCLSPNVNLEVIRATHELGLASIPGAMTPTEIIEADHAGADIVKVFPAGWLGLSFLKDIKGPINNVKFLASAGVNEKNYGEFLDAGYYCAGVSGRLIDRKLIADKDFDELTRRAQAFTAIAAQHPSGL